MLSDENTPPNPTDAPPPLHIVRLEVHDVMKIKAVEVIPGENRVIPIVGPNGSGKSSLLTAVEMAVGGRKMFPDKPVRDGAKSGHIVLDLGEYCITRKITEGGSNLTLENADGTEVKEPQKVLDRLMGDSADPMAFLDLKPAEQRATLMRLAGLDFSEVDKLRAKAYDDRTAANRALKAAETKADAARGVWPATLPTEEVSAVDATRRLHELRLAAGRRRDEEVTNKAYRDRIAGLEAELAKFRDQLAQSDERLKSVPVVTADEIAAAEKAVTTVEETNRQVRGKAEYAKRTAEVRAASAEAQRLDSIIVEIDARKAADLAAAKLPVDGLTVDDERVLFNGVPLSQASTAEQIRVAVAIALAGNPRFRVVIVRDGSLLDDDSRRLLEDAVKANNAQLLLELVRSTDTNGVFLVDGEQQPPPAASST